jgi:hypothetical protein
MQISEYRFAKVLIIKAQTHQNQKYLGKSHYITRTKYQ